MITENLAQKIENGEAKYKTFAIGATGSSMIACPKDSYVVITDFTFFHFIDRSALQQLNIESILKNCQHTIRFASQTEQYVYNVRTAFTPVVYDGVEMMMPVSPEYNKDTYQVHTTDVRIDIWRFSDFANWVLNAGKLLDVTAETRGPAGYGTVTNTPNQNVLRRIEFFINAQNYLPNGVKQGMPLINSWREQFFDDINNQSALEIPNTDDKDFHFTYPLLNVGYVLVKSPHNRTTK